jgi:hypothetical protein
MAYNMGIGKIADQNVTFKRKFRWVFRVDGIGGNASAFIPDHFVKTTKRPSVDMQEVTVHHLHGYMPMPGKPTFGDAEVVYYDIVDSDNSMLSLYNWIGGVYDFLSPSSSPINPRMAVRATGPGGYTATAKLVMLDGCGNGLEQFTMYLCWPKSVDFGDLGYDQNDQCDITVSMKYQFMNRTNLAGAQPVFNGC